MLSERGGCWSLAQSKSGRHDSRSVGSRASETVITRSSTRRSIGVTVIEAIGHGRQRGHARVSRPHFESRFLPKAHLTFIVEDELADAVVDAIVDSARSGNESGDGLVWTSQVENVTHNRTGAKLEKEVEA